MHLISIFLNTLSTPVEGRSGSLNGTLEGETLPDFCVPKNLTIGFLYDIISKSC